MSRSAEKLWKRHGRQPAIMQALNDERQRLGGLLAVEIPIMQQDDLPGLAALSTRSTMVGTPGLDQSCGSTLHVTVVRPMAVVCATTAPL